MPYKKLYSTSEYTPIEISTDAEMAAVLLDDNNLGKVYKFTGTSGTYINGDLYEVEYFDPSTIPLCFTANTAGSTVVLSDIDDTGIILNSLQYSTDGTNWSSYSLEQIITLTNVGDKVYFKGDNPYGLNDADEYVRFILTGSISASGNIMSLVDSTCQSVIVPDDFCFMDLFSGCTSLTSAPLLPATTVTVQCYSYIFYGCTSLTTPPALPATTLSEDCYRGMFSGCTSLTTVPLLPANELFDDCYISMFRDCTSLQISDTQTTDAPYAWVIPTTGTFIEETYSQSDMFNGCIGARSPRGSAASGDDMPGEVGQSYIYYTQNKPV